MRYAWILALAAPLGAAPARADETDDALAKRMAAVVRDFRQPLAVRAEAARTVGRLGARASAAVPDLTLVLDRLRGAEQEPLQEAIIDALGMMGAASRSSLPSLAKTAARTADIDQALRRATDAILLASDSLDLEILNQQLLSRDPSTRLRAVKALTDLGPAARALVPGLAPLLGDPDGDVRRATITAIRTILPNVPPQPELIRAIAVDLKSPDPTQRLVAVRLLGQIGPLAAAAAIQVDALQADPDPDVRRAAVTAFTRIAVPGLPR
jgi:HEAT repeat protein